MIFWKNTAKTGWRAKRPFHVAEQRGSAIRDFGHQGLPILRIASTTNIGRR